jgi:hypothetical protein
MYHLDHFKLYNLLAFGVTTIPVQKSFITQLSTSLNIAHIVLLAPGHYYSTFYFDTTNYSIYVELHNICAFVPGSFHVSMFSRFIHVIPYIRIPSLF